MRACLCVPGGRRLCRAFPTRERAKGEIREAQTHIRAKLDQRRSVVTALEVRRPGGTTGSRLILGRKKKKQQHKKTDTKNVTLNQRPFIVPVI